MKPAINNGNIYMQHGVEKMKKSIVLTLSVLVSLTLLSACDNQEKDSAGQNEKVLRVGATGLSYPGAYKENGKLTGFDVELTNEIANNLHYKVEWVTSDFSGLMGQLEGNKLDTVANVVAITPARQEKYNFSDPYSYYGSQIVTSSQNNEINNLNDFDGKTIAGVLGSNHIKNLQKAFPNNNVTIRTYETRDGAMTDAINRRVEGYVNSGPILMAEIKRKNLPLKFVGQPLVVEAVGYPFHKDASGDAFRQQFNQALETLRQNGRLKALSEKYFGEDITNAPVSTK